MQNLKWQACTRKLKKLASFSQAVAALLINNKINSKESKELLKTQRRITSENRRR